MEPKETEDNTVGACEEEVSCRETMNCSADVNTGYSDADYEELSLSLERKKGQKSKVVRGQSDKRVQLERTQNIAGNDEEYDQLTSKVWKDYEDQRAQYVNARNGNHSKGIKTSHMDAHMNPEVAEGRDKNDGESASEEENADSDKICFSTVVC